METPVGHQTQSLHDVPVFLMAIGSLDMCLAEPFPRRENGFGLEGVLCETNPLLNIESFLIRRVPHRPSYHHVLSGML